MDHYIVAPYQYDETIFRRHRLAAYILEQDTDARIFWVIPKPTSVRRILTSSIIQIEQMEPKVYRIHVYNVWNLFNFGGILSRLATRGLRHHIQKNNNSKVLWYTYPSYPELSSIERWHSTIYDCSDLWSQAPTQETTWVDKARIKLSMYRL
jgi:teichuronic acid biosynthesis glycosyltransferase TuaH